MTAGEIVELLDGAGMDAGTDDKRGFDHGLFIPMLMMYPEADIPVTQLSLVRGLIRIHILRWERLFRLCLKKTYW